MSEYKKQLPLKFIPTLSEPRWVFELKDGLNRMLDWMHDCPLPRGDGATTKVSQDGTISVSNDSFPWTKLAFGYTLSGATCTIYPGKVRLHSSSEFPLADSAELTLTGTTAWVYAEVPKGSVTGTGVTIAFSSTEPATTATHYRLALYKFISSTPGSYTLDRICNMGDFNFDTPLH